MSPRFRWLPVVLLVAVAWAGVAGSAHAHPAPAAAVPAAPDTVDASTPDTTNAAAPAILAVPHAPRDTSPLAATPLVLTAVALLAVAGGVHGGIRRTAAAAVVVLLAIGAFEAGVHSVHHLDDADGAADCSVATSADHTAGLVDGATPGELVEFPIAGLPCLASSHLAGVQCDAGDSRAPPLRSA